MLHRVVVMLGRWADGRPGPQRAVALGGAMDLPTDQSTRTRAPLIHPPLREPARSRRRRPTGEPPPLPHHLQTSGVGWLIVAVALVVLTVVVFARGLRGLAVEVTVADDAVVRWLAGLRAPGLVGVWRALAALSSWWVLNGVLAGWGVALLVLRRFRHLIIVLILVQLVSMVVEDWVGPIVQRPRPFGVVIRAGWGGWALPSIQVAYFAFGLVVILYALLPEGRWRNLGKTVAAVLVALTALGRIALGADPPTGVLVGVAIGVAIPLVAFRLFAPSAVFPVAYRRGRSAHLDVGGARGVAVRRGPPRCASPSRASSPATCSASCTPGATCAPTAGTSSAGSCCMAGWRTRSPSTLCGGWCSRRTTRCGCAGLPGSPVRCRTGSWSSPLSGSTCWSPSSSTARSSWARPRSMMA